jgi:hypothetical protein
VFAVQHHVGVEDLFGVRVKGDDGDGERSVCERVTVGRKAHGVLVVAVAAIADRVFRATLDDQRRQDTGSILPGSGGSHDRFESFAFGAEEVDRVFDADVDRALLPACAARSR